MSLLSLENLSKRYGALVVTDGVSFDVAKGEIVGILGPNGAGKTTLFNLVAGTVRPDQGQVRFQGRRRFGGQRRRTMQAGNFEVVSSAASIQWDDSI